MGLVSLSITSIFTFVLGEIYKDFKSMAFTSSGCVLCFIYGSGLTPCSTFAIIGFAPKISISVVLCSKRDYVLDGGLGVFSTIV